MLVRDSICTGPDGWRNASCRAVCMRSDPAGPGGKGAAQSLEGQTRPGQLLTIEMSQINPPRADPLVISGLNKQDH